METASTNRAAKAGEAAQEAGQQATQEAGQGAGQAAGEVGQGAGQAAQQAGEAAGEVGEGAGQAAQEAGQATQEVGDAAGQVAQGASEAAGQATQGVSDTAGQATEQAGQVAQGATDTAEQATQQATDTAEGAAQQAQETAEGGVEQAQETAGGAVQQAQDTAEQATDQAENATEQAQGAAGQAAQQATDTAEGTAQQAQDVAGDTAATRDKQEEPGSRKQGVIAAGLRVTMPLIPGTAIGFTIMAYILFGKIYTEASPDAPLPLSASIYAVLIGVGSAALIWLVGGCFYSRYTNAHSASRRNYLALRERLDHLENRVMHARPEGYESEENPNTTICQATREQAYARARKECKVIREELEGAGMPWVTGLGYITLWHRVHRAEESLIKVEPCLEALEGAMRDESRLVNSTLENKDSLLRRLRCAVTMLDDSGTEKYLSYVTEHEKSPLKKERTTPENRAKALTILCEVRYEINHFRDNVWEGIVHARNVSPIPQTTDA